MTSTPTDLLKMLGGAGHAARVRPSSGEARPSAAELTRTGTFADLLAAARKGELGGGNPVSVLPGANVELSPDQIQRLSVAADMAQSAGATRALVRIDGQTLLMDVGARSITAKVNAVPGQVVTGIDSVIDVPPAPSAPTIQSADPGLQALRSPRLSGMAKSVADALAGAGA